MADFKLSGGCHCGGIRYTVTAPAIETHHCHCSVCRRVNGALFVTWSLYPKSNFTYDKAGSNLGTYNTSPTLHRHFCKTCGCPITFDVDGQDFVAVASGTLDGGAYPGHPPETLRHAFATSKVPWYEIGDKLPQKEGFD
jgi:hypothetical protein